MEQLFPIFAESMTKLVNFNNFSKSTVKLISLVQIVGYLFNAFFNNKGVHFIVWNVKKWNNNQMNSFFKIIFILVLLCVFSESILFGNTQIIFLTGSQKSGSYIFAKELSRLWESSKKNRKTTIVNKIVISQKNRLEQIDNN